MKLEEIKEWFEKIDKKAQTEYVQLDGLIDLDNIEWLIEQAEKVEKIKSITNNESITKSETVDKISKIVNASIR